MLLLGASWQYMYKASCIVFAVCFIQQAHNTRRDRFPTQFALAGTVMMPRIALGTGAGLWIKYCAATDAECRGHMVRTAVSSWLNAGGRHLDCAFDYGSQVDVGHSIQDSGLDRSELFITSKCPGPIGYDAIKRCAHENVRQLGLNKSGLAYIDLLLIHFSQIPTPHGWKDPGWQGRSSSWKALEDLQDTGTVRAIGVSNYAETHLLETLSTATKPIAVNQIHWSPGYHDMSLKNFASRNGIRLMAYSSLGGWETGANATRTATMQMLAQKYHVSSAEVALQWTLQQGIGVIVSTTNPLHMRANLKILHGPRLALSDIDSISDLHGVAPKFEWEP